MTSEREMSMTAADRRELHRRIAALRVEYERLRNQGEKQLARARALAHEAQRSRSLRWTIRYEQALERHTKDISDLSVR